MSDYMVDQVRYRFPALAENSSEQALLYLDNPAGTQLPRSVIDAFGAAMISASSN